MNNSVRALTLDASGNLVAGGSFTTAGGVSTPVAAWNGMSWTGLGSADSHPMGTINALAVYGTKILAGGSSGVAIWDTGAIAESAMQLSAAADTTTGNIWVATQSLTNAVELRRYTTTWSAPDVLATGITGGDIGLLFDPINSRGMALWSNYSTLYKKDFVVGLVATTADTVQTNARGLFAVGDTGSGADFPLLYLDTTPVLERRLVQSDPP